MFLCFLGSSLLLERTAATRCLSALHVQQHRVVSAFCLISSRDNTEGLESKEQQHMGNVCVLIPSESNAFERQARGLASRLSLPLLHSLQELEEQSMSYTHCLSFERYQCMDIDSYAVAIQPIASSDDSTGEKRTKKKKKRNQNSNSGMKPFFIDFCPGSNTRMGKRVGSQKGGELLLKATALGRNKDSTVYDLTAGLAQDSCIMALGGASAVHMVERDPIVAALLRDAFRRMQLVATETEYQRDDDEMVERAVELSRKLTIEEGDAVNVATKLAQLEVDNRPDICYLDPMFPPRTKSAAVKKNMNILHGLLETQSQDDAETRQSKERDLLLASLEAARRKVVVKRPIQAPPLGGDMVKKKPSSTIKGSVNRWDVYVS